MFYTARFNKKLAVDGFLALATSPLFVLLIVYILHSIYFELLLGQSLLLDYRITGNLALISLSLYLITRVGDEALVAIGEGCSLHHLNDLGDIAMMELGEGCPLLRDIVLSHCRQITDVGLSYLAKELYLVGNLPHGLLPCTAAGVATISVRASVINALQLNGKQQG
ncbi:hypothetical protein HAX54_026630 [Datura stramonium]|uniref:Uncharacterized protein n=1 Tax=Datura stramonium TaxID=4076 RepID=A0ABS8V197_DATST|nr:hypothetical protein [Datura stramonium]